MPRSLTLVLLAAAVTLPVAHAEGPFRNRHNTLTIDDGEGTYPIPYQLPTTAEITE